jgi:pimeloyl-ACP methyl ester carboxylesterase
MMPSSETFPTYFGDFDKPLFGCFNEPSSGRSRSCAVVICQPMGHEYVNSHRALRQLAVRLAEKGFPVLRFDYFGTGDSLGEETEGRVSQWLDDLSQAILEIKRRSGLPGLCLVGLRLGASLSLLTAARRNDVQNLVLWDPIVNGQAHLEEMVSLEKELTRFRPKPKERRISDWPKDIVGFPVGRELYQEVESIDLLAFPQIAADNILLIESETTPMQSSLKMALEKTGASLSFQHVNAPPIWQPTANGSLLVPGPVLQAVTSWMDRICL